MKSLLKYTLVVILSVVSTITTIYVNDTFIKEKPPRYVTYDSKNQVGINTNEPGSEFEVKANPEWGGNADIGLKTLSEKQLWNVSAVDQTGQFTVYNKSADKTPFIISNKALNSSLNIEESSITVGAQLNVIYPGARIRLQNTSIKDSQIDIIMASQTEHGFPDGTLLFYNEKNGVIAHLSKDGTFTVKKLAYEELVKKN